MTPPIDPAAIALRVRSLVELHGTVKHVAEHCGVPLPTMETVLRGMNLPGAMTIACLCKGLGVSADWLLFGEVRA